MGNGRIIQSACYHAARKVTDGCLDICGTLTIFMRLCVIENLMLTLPYCLKCTYLLFANLK